MTTLTKPQKISNSINTFATVNTLVIIDPNVTNPQQLAAGIVTGAAVEILDAHRDGIIQITEILREYSNIDSLHLVAHGSPGCIYLGNSKLNLETLPLYSANIAAWFSSPNPQIFFYGCNLAVAPELLNQLHKLTGANIAASTQEVGQGNWNLEWQTVEIKTDPVFTSELQQKYQETFVADFQPEVTFGVGDTPLSVAVGDLDGDGAADDLAIANYNDNNVSVLLGDGSGGFSAQTTFAVGNGPYSVAIGDLDGDGAADDLAIANSPDDTVSVLLGDGSGGFSAQTTFAVGNGPFLVAIGDLDGDGEVDDLAVANVNGNNVSVLLGNGSGGFSAQTTFAVGNSPFSVAIGDLDGDGEVDDLAAANRNNNNVSVLLGDGSGGFSAQTTFAVGLAPLSVTIGDLDGDGEVDDLAVANSAASNNNVSVLLGDGSGGFSAQTTFAVGLLPRSVAIGDLDGDGAADDIAVTNYTDDTVSVLLNDGSGSFLGEITFEVGTNPSSVAIADLDGDGEVDDLAVANGGDSTVSVLINNDPPVANDDAFPRFVELSDLNGSNGFALNGIFDYDESGFSVSNAGDINGDGFDDLIIGAPDAYANYIYADAGQAYVVFGGPGVGASGSFELFELDGINGFIINGIAPEDDAGFSVSNAGDINGDTIADLIIGAKEGYNGTYYSGQSYVIFGDPNVGNNGLVPGVIDLATLDGTEGFIINGIYEGEYVGFSVNNLGDINGDGIDDLIIGAPGSEDFADIYSVSPGSSYVVFGDGNIGNTGVIELSALDGTNGFVLNGAGAYDYSGTSVSNAGDVNGDGFADLIIGAPKPTDGAEGIGGIGAIFGLGNTYSGEAYVVFGGTDVGSTGFVELASLNGDNGFAIGGTQLYDFVGYSVSNLGDINGDGLDDLIIGAYGTGSNGEGASYVIFGAEDLGSTSVVELSDLDGTNGFVLEGINRYDLSGISVSNAGDINGDGFADLIIGADYADPNGISSGESYVVFGGLNIGSSGTFDLGSLDGHNGFALNGIFPFDYSGFSVSNAGDINGDGIDDLIIGAPEASPNGYDGAGQSYVFFGRDFTTDADSAFTTSNVFTNDSDPNGDDISLDSIDTTGTLGIVTDNGDGTFDYDPNGEFDDLPVGETAKDTFTYTISDGNGGFDTATVTIKIAGLNETLFGTDKDDNIWGTEDDDNIVGLDGNDTLNGEAGNDTLDGGDDNDSLIGGPGDDGIQGNSGHDVLLGQGGNDILGGSSGNDTLKGGEGDDSLRGLDDNDFLAGNNGNDTLKGGNGNDILEGGNDNDSLNGDAGSDTIDGGAGSDTLAGQAGADSLDGGADNDLVVGADGNDTLKGGAGNDTLSGQNDADMLFGQENDDSLTGGDQNDTLDGGTGNDTLLGQRNDDVLIGGPGLDILNGGGGNDRFALVSGFTADADIIQDFQNGRDQLLLTGGLTFGTLTISQNGADTDIIETIGGETLATLLGIDATTIDETDFV